MAARIHLPALVLAGVVLATISPQGAPPSAPQLPRFDIWSPPYLRLHSSDAISSLTQTREGYLWIGTARGVIRIDGRSSRIYNPDKEPALRGYSIAQLVRDPIRGLWIRTDRGSLSFYRDGSIQSVGQARGMPELGVTSMTVAKDGFRAITTGNRLFHLREDGVVSAEIRGLAPDAQARRLIQDSDERLWLTAPVEGHSALYALKDSAAVPTGVALPDNALIEPSLSGGLLIASGTALTRYDGSTSMTLTDDLPFDKAETEITAILDDQKHGLVWIGSRTQGLVAWSRPGSMALRPRDLGFSLETPSITALFQDREYHVWVSDGSGHLHRIRERTIETLRPGASSAHSLVRSVCEGRDGSMWIGTEGGGLFRTRDGRSEPFGAAHGLPGKEVSAVCEDQDGTLWAAVENKGLFRLVGGRFRKLKGFPSSAVTALYLAPSGTLWVGTRDRGLFREDKGAVLPVEIASRDGSFEERSVSRIVADRDGALWIGTSGGGLKRLEGDTVAHFQHGENPVTSPPNNYIFALHADADGDLWIGTPRGLTRYNGESFQDVKLAETAAEPQVFDIFEDGQRRLWLASDTGLLRLERPFIESYFDGGTPVVRHAVFDETDGMKDLPSNARSQPAGWQTKSGKLWIPTGGQIAVLDPLRMARNLRAPAVVIEEFRADETVYDLSAPIIVPPGAKEFTIRYTGISFADPHRVTFRRWLDGKDPDWVERSGVGLATYQDLRPGRYTFHLKAANKDGVWTPGAQTLEFVLLPPFWLTSWFLTLCVVAVILLVRYVSLKKVRARLGYLLRERALENERARIAKDMHDDLGANLTQISLMSELLRRNPENPDDVTRNAERIGERSRQVSQKLDEIVWALNPRNDSLDKLASYLVHFTEEFLEPVEIRYRLDVPARLPDREVDSELRHNIFMTLKEALNNAVKYSDARAITLRIAFKEPELRFSVEDDGKGFNPADAGGAGSDGLANMRRRVEDHNGRFEISSAPGEGTQVTCVFPLPR